MKVSSGSRVAPHFPIIIVGAGIVGLSVALALSTRARDVALIDPEPPGSQTSWGNMGALAFGEVLPLARPDVIRQAGRWLLDRRGPVVISPRHLGALCGWLRRFIFSAFDGNSPKRVEALRRLNALALAEWERSLSAIGLWNRCEADRVLHVYDTTEAMSKDAPLWEIRRAAGHENYPLDKNALRHAEPALGGGFAGAMASPTWRLTPDPFLVSKTIESRLIASGVTFLTDRAHSITPMTDRIAVRCETAELTCDHLVVAAGVHSADLARQTGDAMPLVAERGYSLTLSSPLVRSNNYLVFRQHGFVVAPLAGGLRIGGSAEFVPARQAPDWRRLDLLVEKAKRFLPDLNPSDGIRWYGDRPSTPDSLPVIGPSRRDRRVLYAFGHGHLGLTQAAATGAIIRDLIAGNIPAIDVAPYSSARFNR
ncbi:NAD(P)/FAD-dependent oxidoreductase [Rhodospirillaceae bacterium SYSU D60014]|uniref:NAD(P)/FAD-dependent oxidoreductase n=1 Tax=Virgifigura deserti TaxID=2268457 RepID=UPI000E6609CB